jgi:signal transduction histidine kinase/DNA-binding response OmpR family regulator
MIPLQRMENWLNSFLAHPDLSQKALIRKKWSWIWAVVACSCVFGMTLLSFLLQIWIVFWYGVVLLLFYLLYIPLLGPTRYFERITFIFLLATILATFVTILLLGGIISSVGLIFVGLTCAFSSVLLNKAKMTILLYGVYAVTIILAALLQPYLKVPDVITPSVNLLYYVVNILWITSTTLIFIIFYIKQQSHIEEAEATRLKELDEAKTKLYTHITHEFRTPLTIILGMADLIEKKPEEWLKKGIGEIRQKGKNLLHLVNQMLDLSKIEAGLFTKTLVNGDIIRFLSYLVESFTSLAEHRKITLSFSSSLEKYKMDYDPENLMHIVSNLLLNAIKYTAQGGEVKVFTELEVQSNRKSTLVIHVTDTGVGIKKEDQNYIFNRFYRIQKDSSKQEGSGLGLALTKELVNLLNGQIEVSSIPGKGSTFSVHLPVTQTASPIENPEFIDLKDPVSPYISPMESAGYRERSMIDGQQNLPVLLIVEDNADLVNYLFELLKEKYYIEVATNGKEGFEKASKIIPDIIISDIMMPVMDGYEFVDQLKGDLRTSHIPVIVLTARADIPSKLKGLEKGADAYLSKPFNGEELFIRLEKLIEIRHKMQEYFSLDHPEKINPPSDSMSMENLFMEKVRTILQTHLHNEEFGIKALCRELPMSRAQLYRKFNALTNLTVSKYIRSMRLKKARELLLTSNLSISEIAYQVGFKNLSHFSTLFTEEFGINPSKIKG